MRAETLHTFPHSAIAAAGEAGQAPEDLQLPRVTAAIEPSADPSNLRLQR
ncbi:hypothetical protein [Sinorhizobium terangae]|nr:hypothetical protein [Sinorhizobium terangae]WFU50596.1 hypothetical protein QA637_28005 [Sinorhizobium terangae]